MIDMPAIISDGLSVEEVESIMLKFPQAECPVRHIFGPGVYIREVFLPANTWAIGHHQNFEHLNIMIKGKVKMYNQDGSTSIIEGPLTFTGSPGRKVGYIIEDTIWQNVYPTAETNVEVLEATYLTKSAVSTEAINQLLLPDLIKIQADQEDYLALLAELNLTESQVRIQTENTEDMMELPKAAYKFQQGKSAIEGSGLFATSKIIWGEIIGPGRLNGKRTILGRMLNHSTKPNAVVVAEGNDLWIQALTDIEGQHGGLVGDEITIDYRYTWQLNKAIELKMERTGELLCQA